MFELKQWEEKYIESLVKYANDEFKKVDTPAYIKTSIIADNLIGVSGTKIIDTSEFLDIANNERLKCKLEFLWKEREVFLWNSADEFKMASDEHFALEKLYTAAMNFEYTKKLCNEVISEIEEIFSIKAKGE